MIPTILAGVLAGVVAVGSVILLGRADDVDVLLERPNLIAAAVVLLAVLVGISGLVVLGVLAATGGLP